MAEPLTNRELDRLRRQVMSSLEAAIVADRCVELAAECVRLTENAKQWQDFARQEELGRHAAQREVARYRTTLDGAETWIESCRDLGRGAMRAYARNSGLGSTLPIEDALDIFDRQIDNIKDSVIHRADLAGENTPA